MKKEIVLNIITWGWYVPNREDGQDCSVIVYHICKFPRKVYEPVYDKRGHMSWRHFNE